MKDAVRGILGKRIKGIVVKKRDRQSSPRTQLFLVFDDDTYYEFYSPEGKIIATGRVDLGGLKAVREYMSRRVEECEEFLDRRGNPVERERFMGRIN